MEELSKIAKAHFQASSDTVQGLVHVFFQTMDKDGNGKIELGEFLSFMEDEGYARLMSPNFFEKLDLDQNGTLDFWEVLTLYYIVKSGRPFCDYCRCFIPGTYFTCVGCLDDPNGGTFHACLDCHLNLGNPHTHDEISQFLDNYSLLEAKIRSAMNQPISTEARSRPSPSTAMIPSTAMVLSTAMVPSTAIVPHPNTAPTTHVYNNWVHNNTYMTPAQLHYHGALVPERQKWRFALGALDAAIKIGLIGTSISSCSIS